MHNQPLELVSHSLCPFVQRAVMLSLEKGIPHQLTYIDLANKPDWFRQISPLGKVPLLRVGSKILFESAVICEYLDEVTLGSLYLLDPLEKAQHRAWIEFASNLLMAMYDLINTPTEALFEQKRYELIDKLAWVEQYLKTPYFASESFSLVDAAYAPMFYYFDALEKITSFDLAESEKIKRWRQALKNHPSVKKAFSEDYSQKLLLLLDQCDSYLSSLAQQSTILNR